MRIDVRIAAVVVFTLMRTAVGVFAAVPTSTPSSFTRPNTLTMGHVVVVIAAIAVVTGEVAAAAPRTADARVTAAVAEAVAAAALAIPGAGSSVAFLGFRC